MTLFIEHNCQAVSKTNQFQLILPNQAKLIAQFEGNLHRIRELHFFISRDLLPVRGRQRIDQCNVSPSPPFLSDPIWLFDSDPDRFRVFLPQSGSLQYGVRTGGVPKRAPRTWPTERLAWYFYCWRSLRVHRLRAPARVQDTALPQARLSHWHNRAS